MISEKGLFYESIKAFLTTSESPKLAVIIVHEIWDQMTILGLLSMKKRTPFSSHLY